jgi:hypothetical protein
MDRQTDSLMPLWSKRTLGWRIDVSGKNKGTQVTSSREVLDIFARF